jgi:hypothetical protein
MAVVGFFFVCIGGAVAGGLTASGVPTTVAIVIVGAVAIALLIPSLVASLRHRREQVDAFFRQRRELPPTALIRELFRAFPPLSTSSADERNLPARALSRLHDHLARSQAWGTSYRVGPRKLLSEIQPLTASFEARPLHQTDPTFEALRAGVALPGVAAERLERGFARRESAPLFNAMLAAACFLFLGLMIARRRAPWDFIVPVGALLLLLYGLRLAAWILRWRAGQPVRPPKWLVAPGGVVWLTPRGQTWRVETVDRREAILLVYHATRPGPWTVVVITADGRHEARAVTQIELDLLLRAWLSPLRPPSAETLSDWT